MGSHLRLLGFRHMRFHHNLSASMGSRSADTQSGLG